MQLILVRHADTEPARAGCADAGRALSGHGMAQLAGLVDTWSAALETLPRPWRMLVSPALRAQQTAAGLADLMDLEPLCEASLYQAGAADFQALLAAHADAGALLMVGHNPGLSDLASELLQQAFAFAPAGLLWLDLDVHPARICSSRTPAP